MFILTLTLILLFSYLCTAGISWVAIWALAQLGITLFAWSWLNAFYIWVFLWAIKLLFAAL